jgi:hypothetical protein
MSRDQLDIFRASTGDALEPPARFALDPHAEFFDALKKLDRDARRRFKATLLRERSQRAAAIAAHVADVIGPTAGLFEHPADGDRAPETSPSRPPLAVSSDTDAMPQYSRSSHHFLKGYRHHGTT